MAAQAARAPKPRPQNSRPQPVDKAAWRRLTVHTVTCPSGAVVRIKIPNLALLVKQDAIPEHLRTVALMEVMNPGKPLAGQTDDAGKPLVDVDTLKALYDLYEHLIMAMVVEPALEAADLPDLPQLDLEMLIQIAARERNMDARGVILGVEPLSRWETFRRAHKCPGYAGAEGGDGGAPCPACEEVIVAFSTLDVGDV